MGFVAADCKALQQLLISLGQEPGPVDGVYGNQTRTALYTARNEHHQADDVPIYLTGLDLSGWNPRGSGIDWQKVQAYGIAFGWVKISQDDNYHSKKSSGQLDGFRSIGAPVGGYHFGDLKDNAHLGPKAAALAEAEQFLAHYKPQPGDLVPCLDIESGFDKSTDDDNVAFCLEWNRIICQELGCSATIMYSARWATRSRLLGAKDKAALSELGKLPLWWAEYDNERDKPLDPWKACAVWQYTGHGSVPGIKGRVDLNKATAQSIEQLRLS